ncbi:MAG TPA: 5'-3' exonuclease H3TH domain-containing protein, partial [Nitrospiria bacterium]|nr:5'-3' exonuclease H3TH domain-containing protein [Nitrospiria bacterium]
MTLVTGDKDMFQLVSPRIKIYDTMKEKVYRVEEIKARFGVGPSQMIEIMGLMGDTSDNIPGVPGIGEKTAIKLIGEFGDLEHLLSRLDEVKQPKLRENLSKFSEQARLSRRLATIRTDCPMGFSLSDYRLKGPEMDKLIPLFKELGFESLTKTLSQNAQQDHLNQIKPVGAYHDTPPLAGTSAAESVMLPDSDSPQRPPALIILDEAGLDRLVQRLESATSVALALQAAPPDSVRGQLQGLSLAATEQEAFYIPLDQYSSSLAEEKVLAALKPILENLKIKKYGHDLKRAFIIFKRHGVQLQPISFDTMIASYLLTPLRRGHGLDTIVLEYLQHSLPPVPQPP